jgi:hypothetical protein
MAKLNKIDIEKLREVVLNVKSAAEACRKLNLNDNGGNLTRLKKLVESKDIDTSHWTSQLWSKGKTCIDDVRIPSKENSYDKIFCKNSKVNPTVIKKIVITKNLLIYKCAICGIDPMWNGAELRLQMDHINGIRTDNRLENLRMLCPNCHSQTDTYCSKNRKRPFPTEEEIIDAIKDSKTITESITVLGINNSNRKKLENIIKEKNLSLKAKDKEEKNCKTCGKEIKSRARLYCSKECNERYCVPKENWKHGELSTYQYRGCRCPDCKASNTEDKRRAKLKKSTIQSLSDSV